MAGTLARVHGMWNLVTGGVDRVSLNHRLMAGMPPASSMAGYPNSTDYRSDQDDIEVNRMLRLLFGPKPLERSALHSVFTGPYFSQRRSTRRVCAPGKVFDTVTDSPNSLRSA